MSDPEWGRIDGEGMWLSVPFNDFFKEALKELVPPEARKWDGENREWWIHDDYLDEVEDLVEEHFGARP